MRRTAGLLVLSCTITLAGVAYGDADSPAQQLADLIDRAISERLTTEKISASAPASDEEFLRRVYLDLTGKIPSHQAAIAFLDSTDPGKRVQLIEQLLASPDYGRHFATIWRNLLLRPDANMIRPPDTTPLVNWLAGEFNKGKGWDRIVHSMLTVEGSKPEGLFFVLNGDSRGNPQANVVAGSVGQLFMGVQLACAECHNHPFVDTWKQSDFWGVAAFFGKVQATGGARGKFGGSNITESARAAGGKRNMAPKTVGASIVIPDTSFKQIGTRVAARLPHGDQPKLDGSKSFRPAFADWLVKKDNPYFARNAVNRLWAHFFGKGFANPLGEMSEINPVSHPELLDRLASAFADSGFDQKQLIRAILLSKTYQRSSRPVPANKGSNPDNLLFARMNVKVLAPEALHDSLCQALEVDNLFRPVAKAAAKKKGGANNRFPPATMKQQFLNFYTTREPEGDATEYTHGIPQALRLMNQELFNTGGRTVERLVRLNAGPEKTVEGLYLAVLSRRPTAEELRESLALVAKQKDPLPGYRGVFWALLNSAEFMINR